MKLIPHLYWITAAGVLAAIIWMINMIRFLIRKRQNTLMIGFVGVFLAAAVCMGGVFLLDLPNVFSGRLETAVGHVVGHDSAGREDVSDTRGILIETASGERIRLLTIDTPIHMDEYLEIAYLPHCHIGYIVQRNAECGMQNNGIED